MKQILIKGCHECGKKYGDMPFCFCSEIAGLCVNQQVLDRTIHSDCPLDDVDEQGGWISVEGGFKAWDNKLEFWLNPEYFYITGEGRGFTCEHEPQMYSNTYKIMGNIRYTITSHYQANRRRGNDLLQNII
jgi:hypothetical protein